MNDEIPEGYIRVSDVVGMYKNYTDIDPNVLANAADRGTRVHAYCEAYATNQFVESYDEDCAGYMASFIPWFDENVAEVIECETRINEPVTMLSGMYDMIVRLKGREGLTLIDFKTPVKACPTWELQLAAYGFLYKKKHGGNVNHMQVIQLSKAGKPAKVIEYQNQEKALELFLGALDLYKFFNGK